MKTILCRPQAWLWLCAIFFFNPFTDKIQAQDNPADTLQGWHTTGGIGLNFSQVKLSNWAGGGQSSVSLGSLFNYQAKYRQGLHSWKNNVDLAFGLIRQGDSEDTEFRKTDDLINLRSQYDFGLSENWSVTAIGDFRTQFGVGYEYPDEEDLPAEKQKISEFMAPGFLLASLGFSCTPGDNFSLTLSPLTGKFTFVFDDSLSNAGAFGVDPGDKTRSELGASIQGSFNRDIFTNVNLATNLILFGNYGEFNHIDVNWDLTFLMKVNRFITTTLGTQLIYDHDVIQRTQFRNALTVGLLYNFGETGS